VFGDLLVILSIVLGLLLGCPRGWKLVIGWLGVRWGLIPCVLLVPLTGESFLLLLLYHALSFLCGEVTYAKKESRGDLQRTQLITRFERSPVSWTTGGNTPNALAVRATLDSFDGPQVQR
jgi:hypothetical protein